MKKVPNDLILTFIDSNLQLSSSDSSIQLEVWSQLGKNRIHVIGSSNAVTFAQGLGLFCQKNILPLLYVDALAVIAGELALRAGGQLDQLHLQVISSACVDPV